MNFLHGKRKKTCSCENSECRCRKVEDGSGVLEETIGQKSVGKTEASARRSPKTADDIVINEKVLKKLDKVVKGDEDYNEKECVKITVPPRISPPLARGYEIGISTKKLQPGDDMNDFIPKEIFNFGDRGSGYKTKGAGQVYKKLKANFLKQNSLFMDQEFPPIDYSVAMKKKMDKPCVWKRPKDLAESPVMFAGPFSGFEIEPGEQDNSWFLLALVALVNHNNVFCQIIPNMQSFMTDYCGIFHFRFWQHGKWLDIVIDDLLPTLDGKLVFAKSKDPSEFWCSLLEKAYAKLHGSYAALKLLTLPDVLEDLTGGLTETILLKEANPDLPSIVTKAVDRSSILVANLNYDGSKKDVISPQGLIMGFSYAITKLVEIQGEKIVRLKIPTGQDSDWTGDWSKNSAKWNSISAQEKTQLEAEEGEIWMSFNDFQKYFDRLDICNLNPDSVSQLDLAKKKRWEVSYYEGEWAKGVTAGGCRKYLKTYAHNPQYRLTIQDVDENSSDKLCTLIIGLMQRKKKSIKYGDTIVYRFIGFTIYLLENPDNLPKPLDMKFFQNATPVAYSTFLNHREICRRIKLAPATYCIVPSTYEPNMEAEFMLRIFSEKANHLKENDGEVGMQAIEETISVKTVTKVEAVQEAKDQEVSEQFFLDIAGEDKEIDWEELKALLDKTLKVEFKGREVPRSMARNLISMMDFDMSGSLNFEEFKLLWQRITYWKRSFKIYDKDKSGALSGFELRSALTSAGFKVNNNLLNMLIHRYGNKKKEIEFEDYITVALKLKEMIEKYDDARVSNIQTFLEITV